jgi:MFS family permease
MKFHFTNSALIRSSSLQSADSSSKSRKSSNNMEKNKSEANSSYSMSSLSALILSVALSSFLTGYNIGVGNSSLGNVKNTIDWNESLQIFLSVANSIFASGATIGSVFAGKIANKYGRRNAMILVDFLCIISSGIVINI